MPTLGAPSTFGQQGSATKPHILAGRSFADKRKTSSRMAKSGKMRLAQPLAPVGTERRNPNVRKDPCFPRSPQLFSTCFSVALFPEFARDLARRTINPLHKNTYITNHVPARSILQTPGKPGSWKALRAGGPNGPPHRMPTRAGNPRATPRGPAPLPVTPCRGRASWPLASFWPQAAAPRRRFASEYSGR